MESCAFSNEIYLITLTNSGKRLVLGIYLLYSASDSIAVNKYQISHRRDGNPFRRCKFLNNKHERTNRLSILLD